MENKTQTEMAIIGACLIDKSAVLYCKDNIKPEHLYSSRHQTILSSIFTVFEDKEDVDLVLLAEHLNDENKIDFIGG